MFLCLVTSSTPVTKVTIMVRFADTDARLASALAGKPMLIQWGMRDWCFTPYFLGLWKKAFPSAEADEYGNAGHYLLEDAGESIAARVGAFLRRP